MNSNQFLGKYFGLVLLTCALLISSRSFAAYRVAGDGRCHPRDSYGIPFGEEVDEANCTEGFRAAGDGRCHPRDSFGIPFGVAVSDDKCVAGRVPDRPRRRR